METWLYIYQGSMCVMLWPMTCSGLDVWRFYSSPLERFNVQIKPLYTATSQLRSLVMVEIVGVMGYRSGKGLRNSDGLHSVKLSPKPGE